MFIVRLRGCLVKEFIHGLGSNEPGDPARQFLKNDVERMSHLGKHSGIDFDSFWKDVRATAAYYYERRPQETRNDYVERLFRYDPVLRQRQRARK